MVIKKIVIGTAQMGYDYDIKNSKLFDSNKKIKQIFNYARKKNIMFFDTAMNYGHAQKKIGEFDRKKKFKVITKLSKVGKLPFLKLELAITNKVLKTLRELKRDTIDILLVHNFQDLYLNKNKLLNVLENLRKKKLIKMIGVSVYSPKEACYCLKIKKINFLQIPFNILDQRWKNKKFISRLNKRKDISVQVRSIFLKGLILNNSRFWPSSIKNSKEIIRKIEKLVIKLKKKNKIDLCLSYINSFKWISFVTVGIDNVMQLKEIMKSNYGKLLYFSDKKIIYNYFKKVNDNVLIPTLWRN